MGLFNLFNKADINKGVEEYKKTPGAVLIDVRTAEEFEEGHIPQAVNIPLQTIEETKEMYTIKDTPLFVYCRSGARSAQAAGYLEASGYTNIHDIGGIMNYTGQIEK